MRWRKGPDEDEPSTVAGPSGDADPAADGRSGDAVADTPASTVPTPDVTVDLGTVHPDDLQRACRRAVSRALLEDLGDRGDVTAAATVPPGATGLAEFVAHADGVLYGIDVVRAVFAQVDPRVEVEFDIEDGDRVRAGDVIGRLQGSMRSILAGERTALNFLTHLSAIATSTRALADVLEGTSAVVRDTRKTTPGLRLLEKAAVRAGGGHNHRIGLYDALLVKDNHIAAAGSVTGAVEAALDRAEGLHVQVEVAALDDIEDALRAGATDLLLDNFTPAELRQAVQRVGGRARLEASGNINLETARAYAETGVDRLAVGAITHSAGSLDIGLDVLPERTEVPEPVMDIWAVEDAGGAFDELVDETPAEPRTDRRPDEPPSDEPVADEPLMDEPRAYDPPVVETLADVADEVLESEQASEDTASATDSDDEASEEEPDGPDDESTELFAWRERQFRHTPSSEER